MIFVISHGETIRAKVHMFFLHNCTIAKESCSDYEEPASGNDSRGLNQIIRGSAGMQVRLFFQQLMVDSMNVKILDLIEYNLTGRLYTIVFGGNFKKIKKKCSPPLRAF